MKLDNQAPTNGATEPRPVKKPAEATHRRGPTTLKEIAALVGVSIATVSSALNDQGRVSADTKARVLKAAKALNYVPNLAARGLHRSTTNVVGILVGYFAPAQYQITVGINDEGIWQGRQLLISTSDPHSGDEALRIRNLASGLTDGIILISPISDPATLNELKHLDIPVVVVNYRRPGLELPQVYGDNVKSSAKLVEHLISLGHRRIGFVTGTHGSGQSDEREKGFRAAMGKAGLPVDEDLIVEGNFSESSGLAAAQRFLKMGRKAPSAVFGVNDHVARGLIAGFADGGKNVPTDVSVVGFDASLAERAEPELTTVRHPFHEVGVEAMRLLGRLISASGDQRSELMKSCIEMKSDVVIGNSAAPPAPAPRF